MAGTPESKGSPGDVAKVAAIQYWQIQADRLRGERDALGALLRELEWQGVRWFTDVGGLPACLVCGKMRDAHPNGRDGDRTPGHTPDCRLSSLLRSLP